MTNEEKNIESLMSVEHGPQPRRMDPELFAAIPETFADYVRQHPEVLPDYRPFAGQIVDIVRDQPERLPVLIGPHGIGKSRLLVPALLKTGERQGLQPLGSLNNAMASDDYVTFDWHNNEGSTMAILNKVVGYQGFSLEPYRIKKREFEWRKAEDHEAIANTSWQGLQAVLHQRFSEGRRGPGLFIADDLLGQAESYPWVMRHMGELAIDHDVRLIMTQMVDLNFGGLYSMDRNGPFDEYTKRQLAGRTHVKEANVRKVGESTGKTPLELEVAEQKVSREALAGLLENFGIDQGEIVRFQRNDLLRRLTMVEILVAKVLGMRHWSEDDNEIMTLPQVADWSIGHHGLFRGQYTEVRRLKLSEKELAEMDEALFGDLV